MRSNYEKDPSISISSDPSDCNVGWRAIIDRLRSQVAGVNRSVVVCVECYPGVFEDEIQRAILNSLSSAEIIRTCDFLKPSSEIDSMLARELTDDPVFGRLSSLDLIDFFNPENLNRFAREPRSTGLLFLLGPKAVLAVSEWDLLVYVDLPRWEIQQRQRRGEIGNFGAHNREALAAEKYKRAFFADWRIADRLKKQLLARADFLLDTTIPGHPTMISGNLFRQALSQTARRPFRVRLFFDPGPWGGQWMREVCDLPPGPPNYGWCFDCVPEENSLLFAFGDCRVEVPALDLVFSHPRELLGEAVHARFGTEFPIRFDFLDTMQGGDLSLQVHPLTEYIQEQFGMHYTQDESYYSLDGGNDACVYLGLRENIDRTSMIADLRDARRGELSFRRNSM